MTGDQPTDSRPKTDSYTGVLDFLTGFMRDNIALMTENGTRHGVISVAAGEAEAFDRSLPLIEADLPPAHATACRPGCDHCCHLPVVADALSVLAIAEHIRTQLDGALRARIEKRIGARRAHVDTLPPEEHGRVREPCPLLEDGLCQVYEVRPMICRSYNSFDAERCRVEMREGGHPDGIDAYPVPFDVGEALSRGVSEGLSEVGLDPLDDKLDLTRALEIALSRADCLEEWLVGAPVFAPARVDRRGVPLDAAS